MSQEPKIKTNSEVIGEVTWLLSISPIHKRLTIEDLQWLVYPPVSLQQYKIFKEGNKVIGLTLWAFLSPESVEKFREQGRIEPQEWANNTDFDPVKGLIQKEGGELWLMELIAPFHNEENKHRDFMIQNLLSSSLEGKTMKMRHLNPETKEVEVLELGENFK